MRTLNPNNQWYNLERNDKHNEMVRGGRQKMAFFFSRRLQTFYVLFALALRLLLQFCARRSIARLKKKNCKETTANVCGKNGNDLRLCKIWNQTKALEQMSSL